MSASSAIASIVYSLLGSRPKWVTSTVERKIFCKHKNFHCFMSDWTRYLCLQGSRLRTNVNHIQIDPEIQILHAKKLQVPSLPQFFPPDESNVQGTIVWFNLINCRKICCNEKKPALTGVQRPTPATLLWLMTLTFGLLIAKWKRFQESSWNISTSRLVILAASVFEILCEKKTDRDTVT